MDKKIAILRGINVGGKRKVLMADLKLLFAGLGFLDVETYIQSGNVIFNSQEELAEISIKIEEAILEKYNFVVPVIVRLVSDLEKSIKNNPFYDGTTNQIKQLCLTFLKESPLKENCLILETLNTKNSFEIINKDVFIHFEGSYHKSKLTNNFFEKKLNVSATTRNWKTVLKLLALGKKE